MRTYLYSCPVCGHSSEVGPAGKARADEGLLRCPTRGCEAVRLRREWTPPGLWQQAAPSRGRPPTSQGR